MDDHVEGQLREEHHDAVDGHGDRTSHGDVVRDILPQDEVDGEDDADHHDVEDGCAGHEDDAHHVSLHASQVVFAPRLPVRVKNHDQLVENFQRCKPVSHLFVFEAKKRVQKRNDWKYAQQHGCDGLERLHKVSIVSNEAILFNFIRAGRNFFKLCSFSVE